MNLKRKKKNIYWKKKKIGANAITFKRGEQRARKSIGEILSVELENLGFRTVLGSKMSLYQALDYPSLFQRLLLDSSECELT